MNLPSASRQRRSRKASSSFSQFTTPSAVITVKSCEGRVKSGKLKSARWVPGSVSTQSTGIYCAPSGRNPRSGWAPAPRSQTISPGRKNAAASCARSRQLSFASSDATLLQPSKSVETAFMRKAPSSPDAQPPNAIYTIFAQLQIVTTIVNNSRISEEKRPQLNSRSKLRRRLPSPLTLLPLSRRLAAVRSGRLPMGSGNRSCGTPAAVSRARRPPASAPRHSGPRRSR